MREYALLGAEARARQLTDELEQIYQAFPELRRGTAGRGRRAAGARTARVSAGAAAAGGARRRRKPMTAAQKKAVSERMRKYWAERRKAKAK